MKITCFFLVLGSMAGGAASGAQIVSCPDSITTRQELTQSVSGWEPINSDLPLRLAYVTFYDGPPKNKVSLVNDSSRKEEGREIATWKFLKSGDTPIWLSCSYSGTTVVLARALPGTVSSCSVTYNTRQRVAGMQRIEKIDCR